MAARAAIDLRADKLIVMTTPASQPLRLPLWLPLSDAEAMLRRMAPEDAPAALLDDDLQRGGCLTMARIVVFGNLGLGSFWSGCLPAYAACLPTPARAAGYVSGSDTPSSSGSGRPGGGDLDIDFDRW